MSDVARSGTAGIRTSARKVDSRSEPVALVNETVITTAQLDAAVRISGVRDSHMLREQLKQELIAREVIWQLARRDGYDQRAEVQRALDESRVNAATQLYLDTHIKPAPVSERSVRERYAQIVTALGKDEYRMSVICTEDKASADRVYGLIQAGHDFAGLAREHSVHPSAARGGALDWLSFVSPPVEGSTAGLPLPVAQALLLLSPGMCSRPIEAGKLTVIVQLNEKRPAQIPAFATVRAELEQALKAQARQDAISEFVAHHIARATIE